MKINVQDIVLVAVPENTKKYREYGVKMAMGKKDDFCLARGLVWEFGVLNYQRSHFKTIREIDLDTYYVVGEGCIKKLNFSLLADGQSFKAGIELNDLHKKNKAFIKSQLDPLLTKKLAENKKKKRQKKLKDELLKDRKEYLNY